MPCAVITQPTYLPWLGYFEQVARADTFIFLDTVQFEKQSWQCRNRLKGGNGLPFWLTVPLAAHPLDTPLRDVRIAPQERQWRTKHWHSIQASLGGAPYFSSVSTELEQWLMTPHETLVDLNIAGIRMVARWLSLSPRFLCASDMDAQGHRTELLAHLCQQVGATHYYSPAGSKVYLEQEKHFFTEARISVSYQTWGHPVYPQRGADFVPHMSALDVIANIGPDAASVLIKSS